MNEERRPSTLRSLALAGVAGQAGCLTVVIIIGALLLGIWLDSRFETGYIFTLLGIVLGIPISLVIMVQSTLSAARNLAKPPDDQTSIFKENGL